MRKKSVSIFICMLVFTSVVVSAARIMNTSSTKENVNELNSDSVKNDSVEQPIIMNKQDDIQTQKVETKTGFLSIPASAFNPKNNTMTYYSEGLYIMGTGTFYAPVYLPNEAIVTKLTFHWLDNLESKDGRLELWRGGIEGGWAEGMTMEPLATHGSDGQAKNSSVDEIYHATIDNANYTYYLTLWLYFAIYCNNVQIEYTYVTGGSSVDSIEEQHINEPNVLETH
jgi:hypothetical protein